MTPKPTALTAEQAAANLMLKLRIRLNLSCGPHEYEGALSAVAAALTSYAEARVHEEREACAALAYAEALRLCGDLQADPHLIGRDAAAGIAAAILEEADKRIAELEHECEVEVDPVFRRCEELLHYLAASKDREKRLIDRIERILPTAQRIDGREPRAGLKVIIEECRAALCDEALSAADAAKEAKNADL